MICLGSVKTLKSECKFHRAEQGKKAKDKTLNRTTYTKDHHHNPIVIRGSAHEFNYINNQTQTKSITKSL